MSAIGYLADEVFQQPFRAQNLTVGNVSKREFNMRGTKWLVSFDFKNQGHQMEIEVEFGESSDSEKFPVPVYAEFSFNASYYELVRYHGLFGNGQKTDLLKMTPSPGTAMQNIIQVNFEVRLYPGKYSDACLPEVVITKRACIDSLSSFLFSEKFSDVSLVVQRKAIPAHRLILSSASPVFSALLDGKENKIDVDDIDLETMRQVVECIYTGKSPDLENCAETVLIVADRFQLDWLKTECEDVLAKKINEENACDFLIKGGLYNAEQMKNVAKFFIMKHFADVKKTEGFRKFGESHVHLLMELLQCYDWVGVGPIGRLQKVTVDKSVDI